MSEQGEGKAVGRLGGGLTPAQQELVDAIEAGTWQEVAQNVPDGGYKPGTDPVAKLRSEPVQTALKSRREARIKGPLAQKAMKAIENLLEAPETPAATRFSAAKWVMEQAGHTISQADQSDKPLHEMSEAELHAFMEKAQRVVDGGGSPPVIKVTPENGA